MDSIESELLSKLVNVFSFNFKKNYQDLTKPEFVDIFKLLLNCYDDSWILNPDQPDKKNLKQIQGYLKILELGHLIARDAKFHDLVDPKRNARLLGGLISKLESRHTGAKLQGVIRKIKLIKPKSQPIKQNQCQKNYSSSSSTGEEVKEEELIVPIKGKEIPRTPPVGGKTELKDQGFLKPKPANSPRNQALRAATVGANKNFQPILPTKEIPRTPLKGAQQLPTPTADISVFGRNPDLTVDFSVSRLTSSNTSTPYEERFSSPKSSQSNATFDAPPKLSAELHDTATSPSEEADNITPEIRAIRRGTFVKQTSTKAEQKNAKKMSEDQDRLKREVEEYNDQDQLDAQASPEILEKKKRGGRQPKKTDSNINAKSEKPASDAINSKSDNAEAPSAPITKGKKGRGKKAANPVTTNQELETEGVKKLVKRGKKNVKPEVEVPSIEEPAPEEPAPEEPAPEEPAPEEPAPEEPAPEEPAPEETAPEETAPEEPEAIDSKKRGKRGKNNLKPEAGVSASEKPARVERGPQDNKKRGKRGKNNAQPEPEASVSRLTSSFEERSSPSAKSSQCDATFVALPKLSAELHETVTTPTEKADDITSETRPIRRETFVKQMSTEAKQKNEKKLLEEQDSLKRGAEELYDQHQPDAQASPEIPEKKKRGGRQPKNVDAKSNNKTEKSANEVTDSKPDHDDPPSAPATKGRKGRDKKTPTPVIEIQKPENKGNNKKVGKRGKNNLQPEPEASALKPALVEPETKDNKKHGKRAKNNIQPELEAPVSEEPTPAKPDAENMEKGKENVQPEYEAPAPNEPIPDEVAPEEPLIVEPETNDNKKRRKRGKNNVQPEPEASAPVETPSEESAPQVKRKKGREKAAVSAAPKELDPELRVRYVLRNRPVSDK